MPTIVSILVAVHNAESTLSQCIDSLLRQTYPYLDIICVDDASTDTSASILAGYCHVDSRVRSFHLSVNRGAPHARNVALWHATGDLICFVDSDDWLAPDAIEQCLSVFDGDEEVDCVLFNVMLTDSSGGNIHPYPTPLLQAAISGKEALKRSINWQIHGVYMVRASIHHRYPYDDSAQLYSDDNTTRHHFHASRKVAQTGAVYYYRQHPQSSTHKVAPQRYQYIDAAESMAIWMKDNDVDEDIRRLYYNMRWRIVIDVYMFHFCHRRQLEQTHRREGIRKIKQAWQATEPQLIDISLRRKFGYMPFRRSWLLFRVQEEVYFFLRSMLGRNKQV